MLQLTCEALGIAKPQKVTALVTNLHICLNGMLRLNGLKRYLTLKFRRDISNGQLLIVTRYFYCASALTNVTRLDTIVQGFTEFVQTCILIRS